MTLSVLGFYDEMLLQTDLSQPCCVPSLRLTAAHMVWFSLKLDLTGADDIWSSPHPFDTITFDSKTTHPGPSSILSSFLSVPAAPCQDPG